MKSNFQKIPAGEFKARCLSIMDEVQKKHKTFTITKHGVPVAKLVPIENEQTKLFGCMKGTISILDDIVQPIDEQWEANE